MNDPKVVRLPTAARRRVKNSRVAVRDEGNCVIAGIVSELDIPAERILHAVADARLVDVVVLGFDAEGEFYFGSSHADGGDVLWLLELAKKRLLEVDD